MCYYIIEHERIYHIAKTGYLFKGYVRIFIAIELLPNP